MKVAKSYFRDILGSLLYSPQCSLLETIHTKKKRMKELNRLALGKFCQFSKKKKSILAPMLGIIIIVIVMMMMISDQ